MKRYYSMVAVKRGDLYGVAYVLNGDPNGVIHYKPFYFKTLDAALRYVYCAREI